MEPFDRRMGGERPVIRSRQEGRLAIEAKGSPPVRTPKAHRICDGVSGILICFMVVFTPWAFGTTQDWSVWTMNATAYLLGLLLLGKWVIRRRMGYAPARWGGAAKPADLELGPGPRARADAWTLALAALTLAILGYILVSGVNARATFIEWQRRFDYHNCVSWLPHSYDSTSTWQTFWSYLGLAIFFWATRDWLLGKSSEERRKRRERESERPGRGREGLAGAAAGFGPAESGQRLVESSRAELPQRLRLLLWVLSINGSVLALEAILQRLSGTYKLLWLIRPSINFDGLSQFGPYAYRANAASYFNLVWPVCVGLWLVLRRAAKYHLRAGHRVGSANHLVLLPGAVLMAACPIISISRGGAVIAVMNILLTLVVLLWSTRHENRWLRAGACALFVLVLSLSASLGLKDLAPRFGTIATDRMSRRTEIYENALPIAREFPVFGTGPGTFGSVYQLYRTKPNQDWAAYVHDDWLETRITFGWIGFSLILLSLGIALTRCFFGDGLATAWDFMLMLWIALAGCLFHAKFDFPMQIYSIVLLVVLILAIQFSLSVVKRRPS